MKQQEIMELARKILGQKVSFVHVNEKNEVADREGIIISLHLGADQRIQVRVHDGSRQVNADLAAISLTEQERSEYLDGVMCIRARTQSINDQIKELTKSGNAEIEVLYTKYLGVPVPVILPPNINDNEAAKPQA